MVRDWAQAGSRRSGREGHRRKATSVFAAVLFVAALAAGQPPAKKLKVFISVDMEGVSGLINWDETSQGGPDYPFSGSS
jgi:hypothetical protein